MSQIVVPDVGKLRLLDLMLNSVTVYYRLFTNNLDPSYEIILSTLVEATFPGYSAQSPMWMSATLSGSGATAEAVKAGGGDLMFTRTSDGDPEYVYGYYVTDQYGYLLYVERFDSAPVIMQNMGDYVVIPPALRLRSIT